MTITQLEYIVAVDTYRSFGLAAEKCFITQPTLSMQVQKLEETLGTKLFNRNRKPVTPTDKGTEIIAQARVLLAEGEKIKEIAEDRDNVLSGELRVGVISGLSPLVMLQVSQLFLARHPQVKLAVIDMDATGIIMQLKLGTLDCGVLASPLHEPALIAFPLCYESFVAYVSDGSRLSRKKHLEPADISADELWLINDGCLLREQVLKICLRRKGTQTLKVLEYNTGDIQTLQHLVDINGGAAILPELSLSGAAEHHPGRLRYFKPPVPAREISLVVQKSFMKRRLVEALKVEITEFLPKRLKSKKKKDIVEI